MNDYWHITWVTHNSRISERMVKFKAVRGEPVILDEVAECFVTEIISEIVCEYKYKIFAYNICRDHIHLILKSPEERIPETVKTIKSLSALRYKEKTDIPGDGPFRFWAQKYNKWRIESAEQLKNTVQYIIYNRMKHKLPENRGLAPHVLKMLSCCGDEFHAEGYMDELERTDGCWQGYESTT